MLKCDADLVLCSSNSAFSLLEAFGNLAVSPVSRNLTVMHFSLCSLTSGLVLGSPFSVETILSWNISYFFFFQFYWDSVNMLFSRSIVSDSVGSMDWSLPGSSIHGISQGRVLEWVAISFSWGSSWPGGLNSCLLCLLHWQADSFTTEPPGKPLADIQHCINLRFTA